MKVDFCHFRPVIYQWRGTWYIVNVLYVLVSVVKTFPHYS